MTLFLVVPCWQSDDAYMQLKKDLEYLDLKVGASPDSLILPFVDSVIVLLSFLLVSLFPSVCIKLIQTFITVIP